MQNARKMCSSHVTSNMSPKCRESIACRFGVPWYLSSTQHFTSHIAVSFTRMMSHIKDQGQILFIFLLLSHSHMLFWFEAQAQAIALTFWAIGKVDTTFLTITSGKCLSFVTKIGVSAHVGRAHCHPIPRQDHAKCRARADPFAIRTWGKKHRILSYSGASLSRGTRKVSKPCLLYVL